eukprot:TRINITY_DN21869_c0_g1_i1.p1 TRINITY_DN21869_c0_g1~~TRINITY_DN21869_c0_g1_i1.p1  ORF type:complete len:1032 (-),score=362.49 TRINITY_DN21869_c0_g1_i1:128-3223(-)
MVASTVLQRITTLNKAGVLQTPLRYSEVRTALEKVPEDEVLRILAVLEAEAQDVEDPAEYVRTAAAAAAPAAGGSSSSSSGGNKRKASELQGGAAPAGPIAKRVRALNLSGKLNDSIQYERVGEALGSLRHAQAMTILKVLEDAAGDIPDPTAYIRAAVHSAGGSVPAEEGDEAQDDMEDEQEAGEESAAPPTAQQPQRVKSEWLLPKKEAASKTGDYGLGSVKAESTGEADRIERHIQWMNKNAGLETPIVTEQVLGPLVSVGWRVAIKIMKQLEENAAETADPTIFISDAVGRSGWVWAKAEFIDNDTKVAKRVAWLNDNAGLKEPIRWSEVADTLDALRVPHAMVLLRELEVQGDKIEDPTAYIKQAVGLAGEDDVKATVDGADPDSAIAQRVAWLNEHGGLAAQIDFSEVGTSLNRIKEKDAMQILNEVEAKGAGVKDPTGFIRFKLRAKLAALGTEGVQEEDDDTKVQKRIEWMNDYGGLRKDIMYNKVAKKLSSIGIDHAMTVLKELEDNKDGVENPTSFILSTISTSLQQGSFPQGQQSKSGAAGRRPGAAANAGGNMNLGMMSSVVDLLSQHMKKPFKLSEVASALDALGPKALQVLKEMKEKGLGMDNPVAYIKAAAQRKAGGSGVKVEDQGEDDDVAKLSKRVRWLNKFGGLAKPIQADEVVGALYCLGMPQSAAIFRSLQEKGKRVANPTEFIKAAIRRVNGAPAPERRLHEKDSRYGVPKEEPEEEADAEMGEAEDDPEDREEVEVTDGTCVCGNALSRDSLFCNKCGRRVLKAEPEDNDMEADMLADAEALAAEYQDGEQDGLAEEAAALADDYDEETQTMKPPAERRVVGAIQGITKCVPPRATGARSAGSSWAKHLTGAKEEPTEADEVVPLSGLPVTPAEKLQQIKNMAIKSGLQLDMTALKSLARLPFYRSKDLIDEVLLGGRFRTGVANPSRYITIQISKQAVGLGVEQGVAMELAVSLGVVLNNEALDELASIPRKESHNIIRQLATDDAAKLEPMAFIRESVDAVRAQYSK